jgi:hypothetical protein
LRSSPRCPIYAHPFWTVLTSASLRTGKLEGRLLVFRTEVIRTVVLVFRTELVLTVLIFRTESCSYG